MRKIAKIILLCGLLATVAMLSVSAGNPQVYSPPSNVTASNVAEGHVRVAWDRDEAPVHRIGWTQDVEFRAAHTAGDWLEAFHYADTRRDTDYTVKHLPAGQKHWFIVGAGGHRFGSVAWGEWISLVTANRPTTDQPTTEPVPAPPVSDAAALGGRLRIATIPPVQQLTGSWLGTTTSANTQVRLFTDPLVHTDRFDGSLVPGLATSWEANEDGTQWTFHLRDDVNFHGDWGQFTAHDVPTSAGFIIREDAITIDTGLFRGLFGYTEEELMTNIVALDDNTIQFNLNTPNSLMDFVASAQHGSLFI